MTWPEAIVRCATAVSLVALLVFVFKMWKERP